MDRIYTATAADLVFTGTARDIAERLVNASLAEGDVRVVVDGVELDPTDLADCDDVDDVARVIVVTLT